MTNEELFAAASGEEISGDDTFTPPGQSAMVAARRVMSQEQAINVADIAMDFGIPKDDPLWNIVHALGYHLKLYEQIPGKVEQSGHVAASIISKELIEYEQRVIAAAANFTDLADSLPKQASAAAKAAAIVALEKAIAEMDHSKTIESVSSKVGERLAEKHKVKWARLGMAISAGLGVICLTAGLALGWFIKGATVNEMSASQESILAQVQCSKTPQGRTACRFINGGIF